MKKNTEIIVINPLTKPKTMKINSNKLESLIKLMISQNFELDTIFRTMTEYTDVVSEETRIILGNRHKHDFTENETLQPTT